MAQRSQILVLALLVSVSFGRGVARAQQCDVSDGESIVQGLLDDVVTPFNDAWPAICQATGLDPFDNVYDGSVNLGCGLGDLGNTVCGLQASSCKSMWADVDVSQISGLENLAVTSLTVTSTNANSGTSCPYKSSAVDDTSFSCSYSGEGIGDAALTGTVSADLSSIEIRVECDALGGLDKFKETIWEGRATATATGGTATADLKYCAGICSANSGLASLVYLGMSDLKLHLTGVSTDIVTSGSSYDIDEQLADEIADQIADGLKSVIESAIAPVITQALNEEVDEILPLPSSCSSSASTVPAAVATAPAPPGSLVCYDAGLAPGSASFTSFDDVRFTDPHESTKNAIVREAQVCGPASVEPAAMADPDRRFVGYVLRPEFGAPVETLPAAILTNAFGVEDVSFGEVLPDMLLSAAASDDGSLDVGCILAPGAYRCTAAAGDGSSSGQVVQLADGLGAVAIQGLRSVCVPLTVHGAKLRGDGPFACYQTSPVSGSLPTEPSVVEVASAFGSQLLDPLGADRRLCIPAAVTFATPAPGFPRLAILDDGVLGFDAIATLAPRFIEVGGSCPLLRRHLDPGLGIFERSFVAGSAR